MSTGINLPRPSQRQWAVFCTVVGLIVPVLTVGVWHLAQKAASAQLKESIDAGIKPVVEQIKAEAVQRATSDDEIRQKFVELARYEREYAALKESMKDASASAAMSQREVLSLIREQSGQITQILVKLSALESQLKAKQ